MSSLLEQTSADLKSSRLVLHGFNDSFQAIQSQLCSIMALSEQWSNFHDSFVSIQVSLATYVKEFETKEREIDSVRKRLSNQQKEVELARNSLASDREEVELGRKELEFREKKVSERREALLLEQRRLKEWSKAVEAKAKQVEAREKEVKGKGGGEVLEEREKAIEERYRVVEMREKAIEERCSAVDLMEKAVQERCEAVEVAEDGVNKRCIELERREKAIEEQCRVVERNKEGIDSRVRELELKEEEINERCRLVELEGNRIEERCKALELRDKQLNERCEGLELRDKQLNERYEGLELRDKQLNERYEGLELRDKQLNERYEGLELRDKQLNERYEGLELREKGLSKGLEEMEVKEKRIVDRCKGVELREREIDELCKVVELKEIEVDERCKGVELKEIEVDERCKGQELRDELLSERSKGLDLKEKRIAERLLELELKENRIESKLRQTDEACEELELKEKQIVEHSKEMELKENQIREKSGGVEFKEKYVNEGPNILELKKKQKCKRREALRCREKEISEHREAVHLNKKEINELRECVMTDGKTLQLFLNDRVDKHHFIGKEVCDALRLAANPPKLVLDALEGFFPPHLRKGNKVYETSVVRSTCVLLLEQVMSLQSKFFKKLKRNAKQLAFCWRDKLMEDGESHIVVLGFLMLVAAFRLRSYFESHELQRLYAIVAQDKIAPRLQLQLELVNEGSNMETVPLEETREIQSNILQATDADASSSMDHCSKVHSLCHIMDANGLRSYVGQHLMEQTSTLEKVLDALQCAPDPAKLLLDVVQIFNLPESTAIDKASCICLLELLMKLQKQQNSLNSLGQIVKLVKPPLKITENLRHEAKEFACLWRKALADKGYKLLDVYGFLQFLATYQLKRSFKEAELLRLFKVFYGGDLVYRPDDNPYLCRSLGLAKKIPGLVKTLVQAGRRLQAVKYIRGFMMESCFPLAPLLKDHLKFIEKRALKLRMERNCHAAKIDAAHFEIRNLQAVLQYINDCGLESDCSPVPLESRIEELELQIVELKTATELVSATEQGLKDISIDLEMGVENGSNQLEMKPQASPVKTKPESFVGIKRISSPCSSSVVRQQEKRIRVEDFESLFPSNAPITSPMTTHSVSKRGMNAPPLSPQPWRQLGPCTSGQSVSGMNVSLSPPETLPDVNGSNVQYGFPCSSNVVTPYRGAGRSGPTAGNCPGGSNVEPKTAAAEIKYMAANERTISEKDIVEKNPSHIMNEPVKNLSPTPCAESASESFCGKNQSTSPYASLALPQQEKYFSEGNVQSSVPSNIPIAHPVQTQSAPVNPNQLGLRPWRQPGPYSFGHQPNVWPSGVPMLRPGPVPNVNGPNFHFGVPGGSYGVPPYGGNGHFNPPRFFPNGYPPPPGYFAGGQGPYRPR